MKKRVFTLFICCLALVACSKAQRLASKTSSNSKGVTSIFAPETGDFRTDMLAAVNLIRTKGCRCGGKSMPSVPPVRWNGQLETAAIRHAADMATHKHFDHVGTDGSEIDARINATGYKWMQIGENIAWGYNNIAEAMDAWLKSDSHCFQLMSNKVDEIGAAKNGQYWVQDYGKQRTW